MPTYMIAHPIKWGSKRLKSGTITCDAEDAAPLVATGGLVRIGLGDDTDTNPGLGAKETEKTEPAKDPAATDGTSTDAEQAQEGSPNGDDATPKADSESAPTEQGAEPAGADETPAATVDAAAPAPTDKPARSRTKAPAKRGDK